ncbi:DUF7344 domain-containing protein [Halomontanus rarus]|uniref:DUF7344 domain-containing protein n=1 Tax=Halomontanus rarus TaxID=3034020 RepID=UPI001A97F082
MSSASADHNCLSPRYRSFREEASGPIERASLDSIFDLLSHHRRRAVLDLLLTHDRPLTLTDLRNEVVARERDTEITEIPEKRVNGVHVDLYHVHIPKLVEAGVATYDRERKLVEPTEKLSQLEPFSSQL